MKVETRPGHAGGTTTYQAGFAKHIQHQIYLSPLNTGHTKRSAASCHRVCLCPVSRNLVETWLINEQTENTAFLVSLRVCVYVCIGALELVHLRACRHRCQDKPHVPHFNCGAILSKFQSVVSYVCQKRE